MYPYSVVEGVMAQVFHVRPQGQPALRSRIRNLQRLGLMKAEATEGTKHLYSYYEICELALALSFAELGIEPRRIAELFLEKKPADEMRYIDNFKHKRKEWMFSFSPSYFSDGETLFEITLKTIAKKHIDTMEWMAFFDVAKIMDGVENNLKA